MALQHGLRSAAGASPADPYFSSTSLLLLGNGTNGGQNNTFVDSSTNNFTVTRSGNAAQGSFSPFSAPDGRWSVSFDGSGDYLSVSNPSNLSFGTGAFTVEFWMNWSGTTASPYMGVLGPHNGTSQFYGVFLDSSGNIGIYLGGATFGNTLAAAVKPTPGKWMHIVSCRDSSGAHRFYADGVLKDTTTDTTNLVASGGFNIGVDASSGRPPFSGQISNLRVLSSTALYTGSSITPSTSPLTAVSGTSLLTCQSNRFLDKSTNAFTITPSGNAAVTSFSPFAPLEAYDALINSGSLTCYGGDITSASNAAFAFGTGDFTLECWTYPLQQDYSWMFDFRSGDYNQPVPSLYAQAGATYYYVSADTRITGSALTQMAWNHVAVSRVSGTTRLFINGAQTGSNYSDSTNYQQAAFKFNRNEGGTTGTHIVSGIRVVKGTGLYSSNFSVPTTAPTAISGTSILLNFTNASILDSTAKNNLETVGDAQISTSVKKFGTGSLKFDGTGDYLYSVAKDGTAFGTGDFTIEFWVYGLSSAARQDWLDLYNGTVANRIQILWVSSQVAYYQNNTFVTGGGTYATSTWYHIALTRSSGSNRLFVNGTQVGSTATNTTNFSANSFYLGISSGGGTNYNGYIDDLRITKGVARYTSNFTPPSAQLPVR